MLGEERRELIVLELMLVRVEDTLAMIKSATLFSWVG